MSWVTLSNSVYRNPNLLATPMNVKAVRGRVFGWHLYSIGKGDTFVKLYDKATAPIVGVDIPKITIGVNLSQPEDEYIRGGIPFQFGIWIACVTGIQDTSTTAPPANTQLAVVYFE